MEAIDALKQKVLSLAIQGKLVPQDPNDEPASVLLEKIKTEKAELVKQGKIKKDKQESYIFRGDDNKYYEKIDSEVRDITDEIPFEIPDSWEWVRFKDIVLYNMGKTPERGNKRYWSEATIPWVSISDMLPSQHIDNTKEKITETALKEVFRERFSPKGTLLMSFKLTVGRTSILDLDAVHNEAIISIYPYKCFKQDFQEYLLYFLPIFSSLAQSHDAIKGKTLNSKSIDNILIPLPPENEQKRILIKFKTISITSNYIYDNQEELSKLKDGLKNKILDLAIRGKLVEQDPNDEPASVLLEKIKAEKAELVKQGKIKKDKQESYIYKTPDNRHYGDDKNHYTYFEQIGSEIKDITAEIPFDIPDSWEWVRLEYTTTYIQRGKSPQYTDIKEIPVISQKCVTKDGFNISPAKFINPQSLNTYSNERFLKNGDLLWNSTGTGTVGRVAIYNKDNNPYNIAVADSHVTVVRPLLISNQYVYYYLTSPLVQEGIEDICDGSTNQKELSLTTVKRYLIPLPPIQEQNRIVKKIENLLGIIVGL